MLAKALIDVGPADREIGLQIGQFEPCILKTTNRRSKGVALPNIVFREIESLLRCSDRMQRNGQSLLRQLAHQSSHRAAFRSQQIADRDARLAEKQFGCVGRQMPKLLKIFCAAESGPFGLHEYAAHSAFATNR